MGQLINPGPTDLVISANFLEGILGMNIPEERYALSVSCNWSRTLPAPDVPHQAQVTAEFVPAIELIASKLRPRLEPKKDTYVGKVDSLRGTPDDEGRMQGEVTFAFIADDELLRAKVELAHSDYAKACDAHKLDRYVSLTGVLHRGNRIHSILDHSGIEMVTVNYLSEMTT